MKRFIIVILFFLLIPATVFAATPEYDEALEQFDFSCFEDLGDDANKILDDLGVSDFDFESLTALDFRNCLQVVINVVKDCISAPLRSCALVLCFCVLSAFLKGFSESGVLSTNSSVFSTGCSLVIAILLAVECGETIALSCSTIGICANFIYAFVPVFFVIIAMSGGTVTSISTNTLLLSLSQGLNFISSCVFIPLINCFLALGICSGLRSELNISGALSVAKKSIITVVSFCAGSFVAVLSIKTAVAARADALGLRSVRFAINSVVPVIGSAISEGILSIQSYSSLIKSSVGVVGILGVLAVFLPALISVIVWRLSLSVSLMVSEIFDDSSVSKMITAFSDAFLLLNVILILAMVTTIISIGILIAAKTNV